MLVYLSISLSLTLSLSLYLSIYQAWLLLLHHYSKIEPLMTKIDIPTHSLHATKQLHQIICFVWFLNKLHCSSVQKAETIIDVQNKRLSGHEVMQQGGFIIHHIRKRGSELPRNRHINSSLINKSFYHLWNLTTHTHTHPSQTLCWWCNLNPPIASFFRVNRFSSIWIPFDMDWVWLTHWPFQVGCLYILLLQFKY